MSGASSGCEGGASGVSVRRPTEGFRGGVSAAFREGDGTRGGVPGRGGTGGRRASVLMHPPFRRVARSLRARHSTG
ncbi:hypothetical protein GCM10010252_46430 [Streptomyces aureoverticillatus]|nr:hypothetical protein GCM10010252_46430 [Streptomyces aureoverticillatus]